MKQQPSCRVTNQPLRLALFSAWILRRLMALRLSIHSTVSRRLALLLRYETESRQLFDKSRVLVQQHNNLKETRLVWFSERCLSTLHTSVATRRLASSERQEVRIVRERRLGAALNTVVGSAA